MLKLSKCLKTIKKFIGTVKSGAGIPPKESGELCKPQGHILFCCGITEFS